ncbi:MAG: hypothetical protein ABJK20_18375 [Halieaceae bacterium]
MKTNLLFTVAFLLGATAILWMGTDFIGSDLLALSVTVVIGFVYLLGIVELWQFRQATATLQDALDTLPAEQKNQASALQDWLTSLHPSLRNAVKLRIEGERVGLPAPIFTPYLVGLLIMLGLLGTFVGMVDTLQGAVVALQGSTELEAIRNGLAAPIQGLGLAFGTSVAGVAASAMLGLNSTLSRRERMLVTRSLDSSIDKVFREHSLPYQQQQTFVAIQSQAQALPNVVEKLGQMADELERMGNTLSAQLLNNQSQFHETAQQHYQSLAESVGDSLRESLGESGRLAGESIKPVITETMAQVSSDTKETHTLMNNTTRAQLDTITNVLKENASEISSSLASSLSGFSSRYEQTSSDMLETFEAASGQWLERQGEAQEASFASSTAALQELSTTLTAQWQMAGEKTLSLQESVHKQLADSARELSENAHASSTGLVEEITKLLSVSESLVEARAANESAWLGQQETQLQNLTNTLGEQLIALRAEEEQRGQAAQARLEQLEATAAEHIKALGTELEQPMTRLIETASETPRAAAEVIGSLREELSNSMQRDNDLLEDRQRIMQDLTQVSDSLQQASAGQREAIDVLVNSSSTMLQDVSRQFTDHLSVETTKMTELTATVAAGAVDMASLGDSFGLAIELFNASNQSLIENLSRIEETMDKSTSRSDDQMSYYVAQAREIIDQSMMSQREIIDELRGLGGSGKLFPAEAS